MEPGGATAQLSWLTVENAVTGIADHDHRATYYDLTVYDLAVLPNDAKQLFCAERLFIEGNRVGGTLDVDVGDDCVAISIGTLVHKRFSCVKDHWLRLPRTTV